MVKTDITLPLKYNTEAIKNALHASLGVPPCEITEVRILKAELSLCNTLAPVYKATVAFSSGDEREAGLLKIRNRVFRYEYESFKAPCVKMPCRPVVVGSGPAGLFAALSLAEAGVRPILLERGASVDERMRLIQLFNADGTLNPECNVQFGEGGAGTYSDGKLKVGSMNKYKMRVLEEFIAAGADGNIAYSSSAHLGTDKLPNIVKNLREKIISLGGEFIFGACMTALTLNGSKLTGVTYKKGGVDYHIETDSLILAIGHSARDTIRMLRNCGLVMSAKGFGVGVRIEHPREHINSIVYKDAKGLIEETASYHLVTHLNNGRSVYSFCMCPGGTVVAATGNCGSVVTNGMSEYSRMGDNSNSALLVSVTPADFMSDDPLAGIAFQERIERQAYSLTESYRAPAEMLAPFLKGKRTLSFGTVSPSYERGVELIRAEEYLPNYITDSLRGSIPDFDAWLPGFNYPDAVLTGPETRTTSPVRIERDSLGRALGFVGIFPAGEGAGYAGGIVSSATDGMMIAEKMLLSFK